MNDLKIAPSILSANFNELQKEVDRVKNAELLHIDVMDGHFVENITIGPVVIKNLNTDLIKDVHLMIENPEKFAGSFAKAGADIITFHAEATNDIKKMFNEIKATGCKVGVSLNPDSSLSLIDPILGEVDMVLLMSVFPGFSGQEFIEDVVPKIRDLRKIFKGDIEVDGGINYSTAKRCIEAGANVLVAGSFIYGNDDPSAVIENLKKL